MSFDDAVVNGVCRLKAMVAEEELKQFSTASALSVDEIKTYLSKLNNALRSNPANAVSS